MQVCHHKLVFAFSYCIISLRFRVSENNLHTFYEEKCFSRESIKERCCYFSLMALRTNAVGLRRPSLSQMAITSKQQGSYHQDLSNNIHHPILCFCRKRIYSKLKLKSRFILDGSTDHLNDTRAIMPAAFVHDVAVENKAIGPASVNLQARSLVLRPQTSGCNSVDI